MEELARILKTFLLSLVLARPRTPEPLVTNQNHVKLLRRVKTVVFVQTLKTSTRTHVPVRTATPEPIAKLSFHALPILVKTRARALTNQTFLTTRVLVHQHTLAMIAKLQSLAKSLETLVKTVALVVTLAISLRTPVLVKPVSPATIAKRRSHAQPIHVKTVAPARIPSTCPIILVPVQQRTLEKTVTL
jgi:hypothetical protein